MCTNKIEILNVTGRRESKQPGVYDLDADDVAVLKRAVF